MLLLKILVVILLTILALIVLLLAVIIFIPYTYIVESNSNDKSMRLSLVLLFGLVKIKFIKYFGHKSKLELNLGIFTKEIDLRTFPVFTRKTDTENSDKKKRNKVNKKNWVNHINRQVVDELANLIKKMWARLKPDQININIRAGFDDPMYTGLVYGLYCQFLYFLNNDNIKFEPVFNEKRLEGHFYLKGSVWVIYVLLLFFKFLISSPVRKEIKLMRKEKGGANYVEQL